MKSPKSPKSPNRSKQLKKWLGSNLMDITESNINTNWGRRWVIPGTQRRQVFMPFIPKRGKLVEDHDKWLMVSDVFPYLAFPYLNFFT